MHINQRILTPVSIATIAILMAVSIGFVPSVRADDQQGGEHPYVATSTTDSHSNEDQSEDHEAQDIRDAEDSEHAVGQNIDFIKNAFSKIELQEVNSNQLNTYGDVIAVLQQFRANLSDIKNAAAVSASTSLSAPEQALLNKLASAHRDRFDSLNARIADVDKQMSDLVDILTPIKDNQISQSFGLKRLLVTELKDFRDAVEKVKDFGDVDFRILEAETD